MPLSLSSPCSMTGVQFSVEHGHGDAVIGHPHKLSGPTIKLRTLGVMFDAMGFHQAGYYGGSQISTLCNFTSAVYHELENGYENGFIL